MELREEVLIKAPISIVYQTAEQYPLFVSSFKERQILSQNEHEMIVRAGYSILGTPIRWTGHGIKEPYKTIRFKQIEGPLKGFSANWLFSSGYNNTTEVRIQSTFSISTSLLGN